MKTVSGIFAIVLAIFSLLPSIVPGAMSTLGFLLSLGALALAVSSVSIGRRVYYYTTLFIVSAGIFVFNDGLRFWEPLPMPMSYKVTLYSIFFVAVWISFNVMSDLAKAKKTG